MTVWSLRTVSMVVAAIAVLSSTSALAAPLKVLVSPAQGTLAREELAQGTDALRTRVLLNAPARDLRVMSAATYASMKAAQDLHGVCGDVACAVQEAALLDVDVVVTTRFTRGDGTIAAQLKVIDAKSGVVRASKAVEAISFAATLTALEPLVDAALVELRAGTPTVTRAPEPQAAAPLPQPPLFNIQFGAPNNAHENAQRASPAERTGQRYCHSTIDCPGSGFCKDRGDGVHMCMNNGAPGEFCSSSIDCSGAAFCKDRGDGLKVCM